MDRTTDTKHSSIQMETHNSEEEAGDTRARAVRFLTDRTRDGSLPLIAGAALFARSLRPSRSNTLLHGLAGTALVGVGLRQRRARADGQADAPDDSDVPTGSSEQRAESHQPETNPRGTDGEPDVATDTEPDEGRIQFSEDQPDGWGSVPDLDQPADEDPRLDDEAATEISLSEASLADEASEAAGPAPEQAQPTQTDEIEPEETPEEDSAEKKVDPEDADEPATPMDGDDTA